MPKKRLAEISYAVLLRDRDLYRKVEKKVTFEEKITLLDFSGDYRTYQRNLLKLARRHGVEIPPAR